MRAAEGKAWQKGAAAASSASALLPVDRRGAETNKAARRQAKASSGPARPCPGRFRYYPERARASRVLAARSGTTSPALGRDASPSRTTGKASLLANGSWQDRLDSKALPGGGGTGTAWEDGPRREACSGSVAHWRWGLVPECPAPDYFSSTDA